jgi:hypothetical protein
MLSPPSLEASPSEDISAQESPNSDFVAFDFPPAMIESLAVNLDFALRYTSNFRSTSEKCCVIRWFTCSINCEPEICQREDVHVSRFALKVAKGPGRIVVSARGAQPN